MQYALLSADAEFVAVLYNRYGYNTMRSTSAVSISVSLFRVGPPGCFIIHIIFI
jgi:hypothetical protein